MALALAIGADPAPYADRVPHDVEGTKQRVRDAAVAEFAAHGLHGTTMERIAARAGINKERVYAYFGDKRALFAGLVTDLLATVADAVPLEIERLEDVGEFAARNFDYLEDHPDRARLVLWEGLTPGDEAEGGDRRQALYEGKRKAVAAAQQAGILTDTVDSAHLVFLLLALPSWWSAAPQIARILTGPVEDVDAERARRRAAVKEAAIRIARP